jgi:hypothetical protein
MAAGIVRYLGNAWLNTIKSTGTSFNVAASIYTQLHTSTGNPGATCSSNISSTTTRQTITFTTSTTSSLASSSSPSWSSWAGTNGEILRYVSFHDNVSAGNGLWWAQLSADKTINTGDTFTLTSCSLTITEAS